MTGLDLVFIVLLFGLAIALTRKTYQYNTLKHEYDQGWSPWSEAKSTIVTRRDEDGQMLPPYEYLYQERYHLITNSYEVKRL